MNIDRLSSPGGDAAVTRPQQASETVRREGPAARTARQRDGLTLSPEARMMEAATRAVDDAPDAREERIASIMQRLEDGSYGVSDRELARAMLRHLDDETASR